MKPGFQNLGNGSCAATASHYQASNFHHWRGHSESLAAILARAPDQLAHQLHGRLIPSHGATTARLLEEIERSLGLAFGIRKVARGFLNYAAIN